MLRQVVPSLGRIAGLWVATLWVAAAGPAPKHWAFEPVHRSSPPAVRHTSWPRTGVDPFILAGLEARGWTPAPEASPVTLLRRAFLDFFTPERVRTQLRETPLAPWTPPPPS